MKKILLTTLFVLAPLITHAQLSVPQGGTGLTSVTAGDCVKGSTAFKLTSGPCSTGGGSSTGPKNVLQASDGSGGFIATGTPQVTVGNILATSTTATSTFPNASVTTAFNLIGDYITNVATWFTGRFNANFALKTTDDLTQGSTNKYYSNAQVDAHLSGTAPITYTSGVIACTTATDSVTGCLSAADHVTFNGKQAAGNYIAALTGDVTASGPGSVAATLKNTGPGAGSFTNSNITIDAQGRVTAASNGTGGSGSAYPFQGANNSTSTIVGFTNGLFSTASSTFNSTFHLPALTDGMLTDYGGLVSSAPTSTLTNISGRLTLTSQVTGVLPIANGGTNASSFTTTGNSTYYDGTRLLTAPLTSAVTTPYASTTAISGSYASSTNAFFGTLNLLGITGTQCLHSISGVVSGTGSDCGSGGSGAAYPFQGAGNSTSTLTQFNGGLTAFAFSTIGNGTQAGGLTVNGGATTTGNLQVGTGASSAFTVLSTGNVGVGTTTPWTTFSVQGSSDLGINALAGYFTATTSTASSLPYASTTMITATTASTTTTYVSGLATAAGTFIAADPTGKLIATTSAGGTNYFTLTGNNLQNNVGTALGIGTAPRIAALEVAGTSTGSQVGTTTAAFTAWDSVGNPLFSVSNGGGVYVGTTSSMVQGIPNGSFELYSTSTTVASPKMYFTSLGMNHSVTASLPNHTFGTIGENTFAAGGIFMQGISSGNKLGINIQGIDGTSAPNLTQAAVNISCAKQSGGTPGTQADNELCMTFSNSGTAMLSIMGSGAVGISTSTPSAQLSVTTANQRPATTTMLTVASTTGATLFIIKADGTSGVGTSSPSATLAVQSGLNSGDAFVVATSTGNNVTGVDNDGHTFTSGPAPVISSCGTGTGTVVGDDQTGTITTATAATVCTATFSKAFRQTPVCTVTDDSLVGFADISSISTTAVTFGISSALTGGHLYYSCGYHR